MLWNKKKETKVCHWETHYFLDVYDVNGVFLDNWDWMPEVLDIPIPNAGQEVSLYYNGEKKNELIHSDFLPTKFYIEKVKCLLKKDGNMIVDVIGTNRKDKKYYAE